MNEEMRINKYLSSIGYCSRRAADELASNGRVTVNGKIAEPGTKVSGDEIIAVDGNIVGKASDTSEVKRVVLAVNKPRGIVCSASSNDHAPNIVDMVDYPERLFTVGRLDKDSEGLILMTNDGDLANKITKASNGHEKEYIVKVDRLIREAALDKMRGGMFLKELNKSTRPCTITRISDDEFSIILKQGLNRQIRRMCEECGYKVMILKRIRIMNVRLGTIKPGHWRKIDPEWLK